MKHRGMALKRIKWSRRDHRNSMRDLSAYVDGELEPRQAERLERHLSVCQECQQELRSLRETKQLLRSLPQRALARSFVLSPALAKDRGRYRLWNSSFVALRGVAAALSLVLVLLLSGHAVLSTRATKLLMASSAQPNLASEPVSAQQAPTGGTAPNGPVVEAPAQPGTEPNQQAVAPLRAMAAEQPTAKTQSAPGQPTTASEEAAAQVEPMLAKTSPADQDTPLTALVAAPRPLSPTTVGESFGSVAEGRGAGAADTLAAPMSDESSVASGLTGAVDAVSASPKAAPSTPTLSVVTSTATAMPPTPTTAPPTATSVPPTAVPPMPTAEATALTKAPTEALMAAAAPTTAVQPGIEAAVPPTEIAPSQLAVDRLIEWKHRVRTATGVLAGVLLMLAGGLLFTGYMRRH